MQRDIATDVLVIGGGTAGFGAAIGAARQGARVLGVEGSAALVATHNERLAARMDRVVRLHDGVLD